MVASKLSEALNRNRNLRKTPESLPVEDVLRDFFENHELEDFVLNQGHVNLILQTPDMSAVVVCFDESFTKYGHNHAIESVWSWVVNGDVKLCIADATETLLPSEPHFFDKEVTGHTFFGEPGSVSVHVYSTEAMNISCHPNRCNCTTNTKVVLCNSFLSITDYERGKSVSKICASSGNQPNICSKSLRLFTNFRDLIELLHHEIQPIEEGKFHSPLHIDHICKLLCAVRIQESEYSNYVRFKEQKYTRNLVGYDVPVGEGKFKAKFTVLLLCWDKGQMSPIHDHAGSSCWVKVLQGQVREIRYDASASPPKVIRDITAGAQDVCYINDTQGVHAMGNPNPDQVAISLHIYAPPYMLCKLFNALGEVSEGSMYAAPMPTNPTEEEPTEEAVFDQKPLVLADFMPLVKAALASENKQEVDILMKRLVFTEREWAEFIHFDAYRYTRSLIALESEFSLMILCWNKFQVTPLHDHAPGMESWVKVLRGSLQLKQYTGSVSNSFLKDATYFSEGSQIGFEKFKGLHILGNSSNDHVAVSLHLFSPPLISMCYTGDSGKKCVIPVVHSATSLNSRCCIAEPFKNCDNQVLQKREIVQGRSRSNSFRSSDSDFQSLNKDGNLSLADLLTFFNQDQDERVFTNLHALTRFIGMHNLVNYSCPKQVASVLQRMSLDPEEWEQYIDKDLLARGITFSLWLRCWHASEETAPHRFDAPSWIKVLGGSVTATQCLDDEVVNVSTLQQGSVAYVSNKTTFSFHNASESEACYALQLFRTSTLQY